MRVDLESLLSSFSPPPTVMPPPPAPSATNSAQQVVQLFAMVLGPLLQQLFAPPPDDQKQGTNPFASPLDQLLSNLNPQGPDESTAPPADGPSPVPSPSPSSAPTDTTPPKTLDRGDYGHSLADAQRNTDIQFKPVLRGDEQQRDAKIQSQGDFNRAVDEVAKDYGLDPNMFRAQLQAESGAITDYKKALGAEGDVDRRGENNTSIGVGQISRKFLDGREWSGDGPGNPRLGSQKVSTEDYLNSPTIQLRMAASNLSQRIEDHGSVERGLSSYVNGSPDPSDPKAARYLENINKFMNDPSITEPGRE